MPESKLAANFRCLTGVCDEVGGTGSRGEAKRWDDRYYSLTVSSIITQPHPGPWYAIPAASLVLLIQAACNTDYYRGKWWEGRCLAGWALVRNHSSCLIVWVCFTISYDHRQIRNFLPVGILFVWLQSQVNALQHSAIRLLNPLPKLIYMATNTKSHALWNLSTLTCTSVI